MPARVGFVGLGIMGSRMAANLVRAGHQLTVYNRTRENAQRFADEHGAQVAGSPAEVGERCDTVITMVVDAAQVEEALLGEHGVATKATPGTLCIDCSTIGRTPARAIAEALGRRELRFVDAPVTGSAPRAQDGTLTIMAGASEQDFADAQPLLAAMGRDVVHVGPVGQGQMLKLINNAVAAVNAAVVGEALLVAAATDVPLDALQRVVGSGSGASAMLELKAPAMRAHDFDPLFKLEHMLKDVRLCLDEGQAAGAPFAFAAQARELLTAAMGRGLGDRDFAALIEVLEARTGATLD
jgi:3-hydroxyisobutyrate dehydrogenase-like beta-hydroxyacid dehydrogenase